MSGTLTAAEYRLLIQHSPVMIWRSGRDARCDYFNETWLAFTGRSLEQERGDGWTEGVHPDDFERCVAHYLDHFHRRDAFEMEYRLRRHDGEYRWIFDRGVPFLDDEGRFAGFIGSCVDVDERRRAQDAQQQHNAEQLALARLTGDRQQVAVEVHNRGTIPGDVLPRIFEPFRSGRHYASRGEGLGLGLFIARAIARAHGGGLEVASSEGATMFRLVLPRHAPEAVART